MSEPTTFRMGTNQKIAIASASAQSAAFGSQTRVIRLKTTTDCWFLIGTNPTAAATTGNGVLLMAGDVIYTNVTPGQKVAVIRDTADGVLSVTECDR